MFDHATIATLPALTAAAKIEALERLAADRAAAPNERQNALRAARSLRARGYQSSEPALRFANGSLEGMTRYVRWERIYPGWIEPRFGWAKWRPK